MIAANRHSPIINYKRNDGRRSVGTGLGLSLGLCPLSAYQPARLLSADNFDNDNLNGDGTDWDCICEALEKAWLNAHALKSTLSFSRACESLGML